MFIEKNMHLCFSGRYENSRPLYTFITMQFKTDIFLLIFNQKCCFFKDFSYKVFLREAMPFPFTTSSSVNILVGGMAWEQIKIMFFYVTL
jgi:hypothetical protein